MIYLEKVKVAEDFRGLPKDLIIDLKPITLLVGDQGCGKSTLVKLMQENSHRVRLKLTAKDIESYYFDSENMNPRIQGMDAFTNPNGSSRGIGLGAGLASRFKSHGEVLEVFTVSGVAKVKSCIVLFDEPESGLSLKNQFRLAYEVNEAVKRDVQFIIATHCIPLIESVEEVYDLENKKWVGSQQYINSFKQPS